MTTNFNTNHQITKINNNNNNNNNNKTAQNHKRKTRKHR